MVSEVNRFPLRAGGQILPDRLALLLRTGTLPMLGLQGYLAHKKQHPPDLQGYLAHKKQHPPKTLQ